MAAWHHEEGTDVKWLQKYGFPEDIRLEALRQIRILWAYESTGIEGNTLDFGDTKLVMEEGITIGGKTLREHNEVVGHGRVTDRLETLGQRPLETADVLALHRGMMGGDSGDVMCPNGAWKREENAVLEPGTDTVTWRRFAQPQDVPALMEAWAGMVNEAGNRPDAEVWAKLHTAFVNVHPFWDGNGRMARVLANLPRLRAGEVPWIISRGQRRAYMQAITADTGGSPAPDRKSGPWRPEWNTCALANVVRESNRTIADILHTAQKNAQARQTGVT